MYGYSFGMLLCSHRVAISSILEENLKEFFRGIFKFTFSPAKHDKYGNIKFKISNFIKNKLYFHIAANTWNCQLFTF